MIERKNLHFKKAVISAFNNIQTRFNFIIIEANDYIVEYTNKIVYLNVYHEKLSYEIYFEIGKCPEIINNKYNINLNDIMEVYNIDNGNKIFFATTNNEVIQTVNKLVKIVESYCIDGLLGDESFFNYILKEIEKKHYYKREKLITDNINKKLNIAWRNKEYKLFVNLCNEDEYFLNNIQKRRYLYAVKIIEKLK